MDKILMVWPASKDVKHINYHYTDFGEIVDYLANIYGDNIVAIDQDIDGETDIVEFIKQNNIKKVGMQVNFENASNAFSLCDSIKQADETTSVMAYGNIAHRFPVAFKNSNFDAVSYSGDYEIALASFFENFPDVSAMYGVEAIRNGEMIKSNPGYYKNPDDWGYSKPSQVPVFEYDKAKGKNRYVLNISRGCPYGCPHCLIPMIEGRKERRRSVVNAERALQDISQDYKHIKIWAANFTLDKNYVADFCEMMQKFPDLTWEVATRIDLLRDENMLKAMANSGCTQISIGIESLNSGRFIKSKPFQTDEVLGTIKRVQAAGIRVKGCIMLGIPGQTKQDIIDTLKFLQENHVTARPTVYTPYQDIDSCKLKVIGDYNRKTYRNTNVEGVSPEQLIELTKHPFEYDRILQPAKRDEKI